MPGPEGAVGVPTVAVTVTSMKAEDEPGAHPSSVMLTVAMPENPASQVTVAEVPDPSTVFPAPLTAQV